jgi:DNA modification methylase
MNPVVVRLSDSVSIINADCLDVLPVKCDAVVTDPPYQIGKAWKRAFHGRRGKSPLWGKDQVWDELHPIVPELPNMADVCVIWGGNFYPLPPSRCWMVWDKLQENRGSDCELAWVQADIAPKVFRMSRIDAYVNKAEGLKKTHPAQKPLPLMEWCLRQLKLTKGATVCDPFMGSGTTGVACIRTGRKFIGVEKSPEYFKLAKDRLTRELEQGLLPITFNADAHGRRTSTVQTLVWQENEHD